MRNLGLLLLVSLVGACSKKDDKNKLFYINIHEAQHYSLTINHSSIYLIGGKASYTFGSSAPAKLEFFVVNETGAKPLHISIKAQSTSNLTSGIGDLYFGTMSGAPSSLTALYYVNGDQFNNTPNFQPFPSSNSGKVSITKVGGDLIKGTFELTLSKTSDPSITKSVTGDFKLPM